MEGLLQYIKINTELKGKKKKKKSYSLGQPELLHRETLSEKQKAVKEKKINAF